MWRPAVLNESIDDHHLAWSRPVAEWEMLKHIDGSGEINIRERITYF